MREVIAGTVVLVCLVLIPGSAFAYWVPDSYGQGIGPGLPGPQGGCRREIDNSSRREQKMEIDKLRDMNSIQKLISHKIIFQS
jgi:hypothetical protein